MKLTKEILRKYCHKGSFTKEQIAALGLTFPLPKGWRNSTYFSAQQITDFILASSFVEREATERNFPTQPTAPALPITIEPVQDHHHHFQAPLTIRIEEPAWLTGVLHQLIQQHKTIMAALDDLKAQVARVKDVDDSAVALLKGLKAKLDAAIASGDPAAVQALSDELGKDTDGLAAAVTENT